MSASGLPRLTRTRLYEQVAEQITAWIRSNGLMPGDRLPPERELAQRLGEDGAVAVPHVDDTDDLERDERLAERGSADPEAASAAMHAHVVMVSDAAVLRDGT